MKKAGTTITFVLVCVAVLFASYGIGLGIREIRFKNAGAKTSALDKTEDSTKILTTATNPPTADGPEATFTRRGRDRTTEDGTQMRQRFENMSEEEMSQMRDRFGGGRRGRRGTDLENLSEEERAAMEEQRRQRMERIQNMTEEERSQMRGGRGGRGGRSSRNRGDISGFESEENNSGQENNDIE